MKVDDQYRTNPLSLKPGGSEVTILENGYTEPRTYDKIKDVGAYLKSVMQKKDMIRVWVNGELFWDQFDKDDLLNKIRIYE